MIRISAAVLALASLVSLSACGAGGSEFATKATAACIKDEGQGAAAKCACQVALLEKELTDKEKKAVMLSMDMEKAENTDPTAGMKAMEAAGITMGDMMSMGMKMIGVSAKVEAQCGK